VPDFPSSNYTWPKCEPLTLHLSDGWKLGAKAIRDWNFRNNFETLKFFEEAAVEKMAIKLARGEGAN
jgi:hypothetical protein